MECSRTDISEDRIVTLEQKVTNMEALVKGLIAELPDFRGIARTMSRNTGECNCREIQYGLSTLPSAAAHADISCMVLPEVTHLTEVLAAPAEPKMVRIMQSDGTMKLEPRYGETKRIDSSGGYGKNRKGISGNSTQKPLIYAAKKDTSAHADM